MVSRDVRRFNCRANTIESWDRPLRQQRRLAPFTLHVAAIVLTLVGVAELALAMNTLGTALAAVVHVTALPTISLPRHMQSPLTRLLAGLMDALLPIAPGLTLLIGAVVSLSMVALIWRGQRVSRRYAGAGIALVTAFNGVIWLNLVATISTRIGPPPLTTRLVSSAPGSLNVASSRPSPSAPIRPVMVDRVLTDDTATYVEYRILDEPRDGQPQPVLFDDHGRRYDVNIVPFVDLTFREFLNQLMPWHAPVREQAVFPPLPSGTRFVTLRFIDMSLGQLIETVHVPLSLRGTTTSSPVLLATLHGIRLRITATAGLRQGRLSVVAAVSPGLVPRGGLSQLTFNGRFITANARPVTLLQFDSACQAPTKTSDRTPCTMWLTFKLPRPATRLKLEIHNVVLYDKYDHQYPIVWSAQSWFAVP